MWLINDEWMIGSDSDCVIGPERTIKAAYIEEYPWHLIKKIPQYLFHILRSQIKSSLLLPNRKPLSRQSVLKQNRLCGAWWRGSSSSLISVWVVQMKGRRWIDREWCPVHRQQLSYLMEVRRGQLARWQGHTRLDVTAVRWGRGEMRDKNGGRSDLLLSHAVTFRGHSQTITTWLPRLQLLLQCCMFS